VSYFARVFTIFTAVVSDRHDSATATCEQSQPKRGEGKEQASDT